MLLLHLQDSQEGLLSSRGGGGGADILAPGLHYWFCDVTAFTKSLIRLDNLSQPVLRRESSGLSGSSLRALESELREQEERVSADAAHLLNCPILDTAHRRLVESECPYGAEPRPCPWFLMISACVI